MDIVSHHVFYFSWRGEPFSHLPVEVTVRSHIIPLEVPPDPEPEDPVYDISISPSFLDFGTLTEYNHSALSQDVTLTNNSTVPIKFSSYAGGVFGTPADDFEVAPGESHTITVTITEGLPDGTFDTDLCFSVYGREIYDYFEYFIPLHLTVLPNDPEQHFAVQPSTLDFGTFRSGGSLPPAQSVTVRRTGEGPFTFRQPSSSHFTVTNTGESTLFAGDSTTFTVQPKAGLAPGHYSETITIPTTLNGIGVELTASCTVTGDTSQTTQRFTDVSPTVWYAGFVNQVVEKGLFAGTSSTTFSPESNMTYAEFLTVLSQFSGDTIPTVPAGGNWYDGFVQWAQPLLPAAIADDFDPNAPITRQDMAALFGTFLALYDYSAAPVHSGEPSFSDSHLISEYARSGVTLCYQLGIMSGSDDGAFYPSGTATRAQVAVTMVQMARIMGR